MDDQFAKMNRNQCRIDRANEIVDAVMPLAVAAALAVLGFMGWDVLNNLPAMMIEAAQRSRG